MNAKAIIHYVMTFMRLPLVPREIFVFLALDHIPMYTLLWILLRIL